MEEQRDLLEFRIAEVEEKFRVNYFMNILNQMNSNFITV